MLNYHHPALTRFRPETRLDVSTATISVLVADDSCLVRRHLIDWLSAIDGVEVVGEAGDVGCAIELVSRLRPHAVVLDIGMPGGSGIQVLRHVKRVLPETQVIMLTNNANPFYRATCVEAGASFFFDKSSEFERVGDVLQEMRR